MTVLILNFKKNGSIIRINYPFIETGNAQIFIANCGLEPSSFTSEEMHNGFKNLDEWWLNTDSPLPKKIIQKEKLGKSVAAFIYKKQLSPKSSIKIVQIVGSSLISEAERKDGFLNKELSK